MQAQSGDCKSNADVNTTALAQSASSDAQQGRLRGSAKRQALGFTPLPRKLQANLMTPSPATRPQNEHLNESTHPNDEKEGADGPGSLAGYHSPGQFETPAMARLPAPGQCMEQAAALNTAEPSSDVPTHQPAGTSGMRCLAVRSPQPMQARRQWGVLSLQQQAARPPEPQENSEQQPQQPLPTNRAPLAEHSQNDSDFLDVSRSRGFQGAGPKRRSHRAAPLRNGRPGNAVAPSSVRPVEVADPLDISPEASREGDESNEPAREQPQWRRKQGLSMEPAGRADREANLVSTGLQLALNLAASPSDAQGSGAAGTEAAQPREDGGEEETGRRQHEAQDADSMNVSTGHPLAGMSFVPETCLPVLSLPPFDTVPDTPDARSLPGFRSAARSMCSSVPAAGHLSSISAQAQQSIHTGEGGGSEHARDAYTSGGQGTAAANKQRGAQWEASFMRFARPVLAAVPCTSTR